MPASVAVFKHTHNSNTVAGAGMGAWRLAWKGEAWFRAAGPQEGYYFRLIGIGCLCEADH